jgi:hypothetical protein
MGAEKKPHTTLEECIAAGGARNPKSKQVGLATLVEHFLGTYMNRPEGIEKKSQRSQGECDAEMRGFYKAQEKLREYIAMGGTEAIAELADVRDEHQMRPKMLGNLRVWMG